MSIALFMQAAQGVVDILDCPLGGLRVIGEVLQAIHGGQECPGVGADIGAAPDVRVPKGGKGNGVQLRDGPVVEEVKSVDVALLVRGA